MPSRVVLFGAFDRHNLGDLLFPHIAAALLPGRDLVFAGLAERDLRPHGGHAVAALSRLTIAPPATLIHVGGEILSCSAWQAAVMLLPPTQAQPTIAYLAARPAERAAFVRELLGTAAQAPYVVSRDAHPALRRVIHAGVGGADLDHADAALRAEVLARLREADAVGVRDRQTQSHLTAAGIPARLLPDPAALVAELFGDRIRRRAGGGETAAVRRALPQGYLAVQCSAEFGDDATLATMAAQLDAVAARARLGVVLFRAGAAPWHDDVAVLQRLARRLRHGSVRVFDSLHLWDLCALIAASRGYCGSSLHGRIVATAFGLPRLNLRAPVAGARVGKHAAYAATWEGAAWPAVVDVHELAAGLQAALAADPAQLQAQAHGLAAAFRQAFAGLCAGLA